MYKKPIYHILVIDDQVDTFLLFEQHFKNELQEQTINLFFAQTAENALKILEESSLIINLVLILSDIDMPGMRGLELLKKIKEKTPQMPLFMLIAYGDESTAQKALELGATEIIVKPINFPFLKNLIIESLNIKTGRDDDQSSCCG